MFAYSDKTENYIYTYKKIECIPDFSEYQAEIELVDNVEIPISVNTDLYSACIAHYTS